MNAERHIYLDPESPTGKHARQLALRLIAARVGAGRGAGPAIYFDEFSAVLGEATGNVELLAHMVNELTEAAWALVHLVGEPDLEVLRDQDTETIIAMVERWLDDRPLKPPEGD